MPFGEPALDVEALVSQHAETMIADLAALERKAARGAMLKGLGLTEMWTSLSVLGLFVLVVAGVAMARYRTTLDERGDLPVTREQRRGCGPLRQSATFSCSKPLRDRVSRANEQAGALSGRFQPIRSEVDFVGGLVWLPGANIQASET